MSRPCHGHRAQLRVLAAVAFVAAALVAALVQAAPAAAAVPSGPVTADPAATNKLQVWLDSSGVVGADTMSAHLAGTEWPAPVAFQPRLAVSLLPPGVARIDDGPKVIEAKYQNAEGESALVTANVFLDRRRPTTQGFSEEVRRGGVVRLEFKVKDPAPSCGTANVSLVVYRFGKLKTTFKLAGVQVNRKRYSEFTCRWDKGWYTYKVKARDAAGNPCKSPAFGVLFVK